VAPERLTAIRRLRCVRLAARHRGDQRRRSGAGRQAPNRPPADALSGA